MRRGKCLTGKLLAILLAGTLSMGSLSTAVFADENTADTSEIAAAEMAEDTEEDLAGDSAQEAEDTDLFESADTADSEAENGLDEEKEPAEETSVSEEESGSQEGEEEPEDISDYFENNTTEEDTADDVEQGTAGAGEESAFPEEDAEDPEMIPQDSEQVELENPSIMEPEDHLDPVYSDGVRASKGAARRAAVADVVDLSSLTILPTDVTTPSSGCVLLGLHGKYISQVDAALDRINEIRLEACREGVINPVTNQPLTEADYVPIKWSRQLEYIARIRAAEAALTVQHLRTNGGDCFSIQSEDGTSSYGEILAWNWSNTMTKGIEQWYEEKEDWVNNTAGAVTGHYTQMIDPTHLYIGLGTFCSNSAPYYNSTAGEFSFKDGLDESSMDMEGECIQTLEINSSYLSGTAAISGASEGVAGESSDHIFTIGTSYDGYTASGLIFLNNVSWSSSDAAVASVSGGTVTAKKCGETVITASNSGSGKSAEMTFTVNHNEKTLPAKKPTCTESGLTEGTQCTACGEILKAQEVIPATGHTIVTDKAVAATCTESGKTEGSHCSVCEAVLKAQSEIPATGHAWDSGVVTKEPTCTEDGTRTYTCSNDKSHTKTETINALGHTTVTDPAVAATCTTDGKTEGSHCSTCGEILNAQTVIRATGHAWDDGVVTKEPTCTTIGTRTYTCGNDKSHTKTEAINALGHRTVTDPAVAATCTKDGKTEGSHCSTCGEILKAQTVIKAIGHAWDDGVVTKEPTCTEEGERTYTCGNNQSHTKTETIKALGHTIVTDKAVAATCTETGKTEGSHCSVCGEILKAQTVIKATGHTIVTDKAIAATCTKDGLTEGTHCSVCGQTLKAQAVIPATGHKSVTDQGAAATCTKDGLTEGSHCSVCGEILKAQTVIKATGHAWDDGVVTKEPTCTEDGTRTYTCGNDKSHTKTEAINALGHTIVTDKAVAATCTETGKTEGSHCSVCETVLKAQEVIQATGHAWDDGVVTKEPTCTETGSREKICANCNDKVTETIPAKGHNWSEEYTVDRPATYTEEGSESIHCRVCDVIEEGTSRIIEKLPKPVSMLTVSEMVEKSYTGNAHTQEIVIKDDATELTDGTDYTVTYSNNTNAGTAVVTITGIGSYTGTRTETFKINPVTIADAEVSGIVPKTYTGKTLTQAPVVKVGAAVLQANTDYKVAYSNNINVGTATVTITGTGNYTGTKSTTFKINKEAQSIAVKASAASIAVGKTSTISITGNKGTKSYKSSNTAVATVNATGTVTAKKVGTVTITATSAATANYNAASKAVTIKVVPAATASITAANQATGIKLTWKKVAGATGYKVYRGATLIKTIKSGATVTCTDTKANTNGTKYIFKVIPTASTGNGLAKTLTTYRVARPAVSSAANTAAKKMTVKWKKNAKANGYQIQYSTNKKFASGNKTVNITKAATVSRVIGSLVKGKTYYVRIRTYKTVGKVKYWSAWSTAKSVKIAK